MRLIFHAHDFMNGYCCLTYQLVIGFQIDKQFTPKNFT